MALQATSGNRYGNDANLESEATLIQTADAFETIHEMLSADDLADPKEYPASIIHNISNLS